MSLMQLNSKFFLNKSNTNRIKLVTVTLLLFVFFLSFQSLKAQSIDILLKGGHVIDPKNKIDSKMDVAITDGKISQVAANISPKEAKKVIDVTGLYVTPGLIDIHVHAFWGTNEGSVNYSNGRHSVQPDGFTLRAGVTTVVDAGSSGWRNFEIFKKQTIDESVTRVLAILNISGGGMDGSPNEGGNLGDMDAQKTGEMGKKYPNIIVGVKHAHWGRNNPVPPPGPDDYIIPIKRGIEAAGIMGGYFMLDGTFNEITAPLFRAGDIFTHCFTGPLIDEKTGKIKSYVMDAKNRGVVFDLGHGGGAFKYANALPAMKLGFIPNTISSDLHTESMNSGMKDYANLLSKCMAMGMSLQDVILRATWNPAKVIKHTELGNLSVGTVADVAVLSLKKGNFGFLDVRKTKLKGTQKLEAELTIRAGKIVWDLNGISAPVYVKPDTNQ